MKDDFFSHAYLLLIAFVSIFFGIISNCAYMDSLEQIVENVRSCDCK